MKNQALDCAFELKREPDQDGVFEGYASVFNIVDQGMDTVERGAFSKSLESGRKVRMLWQHDQSQPIGVWDAISEDERGLHVKGRLLKEVSKGAEAMALLKAGAIDGMSIGYRTIQATNEGNGRVRKLLELDLREISIVTFPMLEQAQVTDIKSIRTIRDFEKALRDAGFSQRESKAIAAEGFKGLADHRDDVDVMSSNRATDKLLESLTNLQRTMKNERSGTTCH